MGAVDQEVHYEFWHVRRRQGKRSVHNRSFANPVVRTLKKTWDSSYSPRGARCGAWLRENALAMSIELDRTSAFRMSLMCSSAPRCRRGVCDTLQSAGTHNRESCR